jgi:muramoyltetrapeptide carboxypeptidase
VNTTIRIIRPASREQVDLLPNRIKSLEKSGFQVRFDDLPTDPQWTYTSSSIPNRSKSLRDALEEKDVDIIVAARGGYGCSDLLSSLDFDHLRMVKPKTIVGFSDTSALHSALYTHLGWQGLHAPMPATSLWNDGDQDIKVWEKTIHSLASGSPIQGSIEITPLDADVTSASGKLFGGCFSVLCNLIGTPYFPTSLAGHIIFLEDTGENPARISRYLNQWIQSGALKDAAGLVFGYLQGLGSAIPDCAPYVYEELARRSPVPTFWSKDFGHVTPNYPLLIGADAQIANNKLVWKTSGSNS